MRAQLLTIHDRTEGICTGRQTVIASCREKSGLFANVTPIASVGDKLGGGIQSVRSLNNSLSTADVSGSSVTPIFMLS